MNLLAANLLATFLSFVAAGLVAAWYVAPALTRRPLAQALTLLMWVEAFRYVALQIFSAADVAGLTASGTAQRVIAFGDLTTAVLALMSLIALRRLHPSARPLVWVVAVVGAADLVSATATGISERLTDTASDWSWVILAFYVPALWVTAVLTFWQLLTRRQESLRRDAPAFQLDAMSSPTT
ncbi:MAG: hypothetical protein HOQ45_09460 [Nocardioidaceae bacterium]|nr:hypothetical protein [Nocardioidaceae bacterium]